MRTLAWLALLVFLVACGKYGDPRRHPPLPREAASQPAAVAGDTGAEATTPDPVQDTEVDEP